MPDGDRVYGRLTQDFEKPYEQICEWHFPPDEIAHNLLRAVGKEVQRHGKAPVELVLQVADRIDQLPSEPLFKPTFDWGEESRTIERLASGIIGRRRDMDLAVDACKQYLRAVELGRGALDHREALVQTYIDRVYRASFEGLLPPGNHRDGVSHAVVLERLSELDPVLQPGFAAYARQIARSGEVSRLRRPSLERPAVDADTDLLAAT